MFFFSFCLDCFDWGICKYGSGGSGRENVASAFDCQRYCQQITTCQIWTLYDNGDCNMEGDYIGNHTSSRCVSGPKTCP